MAKINLSVFPLVFVLGSSVSATFAEETDLLEVEISVPDRISNSILKETIYPTSASDDDDETAVESKDDKIDKKVIEICGKSEKATEGGRVLDYETCKKNINESMMLGKLGWGVGLSLTLNKKGNQQVSEAIVDANNFIRVTDHKNAQIRPMIEVNAMIGCENNAFFGLKVFELKEETDVACGPFFAGQVGDDKIFTSFGGGWMWSFNSNGKPLFNVGIGIMVDPGVKMLLKGINADEALPANFLPPLSIGDSLPESAYRRGTQYATVIMITTPLNAIF